MAAHRPLNAGRSNIADIRLRLSGSDTKGNAHVSDDIVLALVSTVRCGRFQTTHRCDEFK